MRCLGLFAAGVLAFSVLSTEGASAKEYYVSPEGRDSASGSLEKPFKTIQWGVDQLASGDVLYIREGHYRENITIEKSNITLSAYKDEHPVISGGTLVGKWKPYKGEIYRAKVSGVEPQFTQLLYNDEIQKMARYPDHTTNDMFSIEDDSGYIGLEVKKDGAVVFDEALPGGVDHWKGGYFRAISAKAGATNPNGRVASSNGRNIQCDEISQIWAQCSKGKQAWKAIGKGKGYIFHLNALSREGEWWYEKGYIYFWRPNGGGVPEEGSVEVQQRNYTITATGQRNVSLIGLSVRLSAIKFENMRNSLIKGCDFNDMKGWMFRKGYGHSYTELGGVFINGYNIKIEESCFAGSWGNLLNLSKSDGINIDNCIFENNGWMGFFTSSILNNSDNLTITNSTFGSTGRFHLRSDGEVRIVMMNNDLSDCMKMCQDAGSIELTNTGFLPNAMNMQGSVFAYNKFHDMNTLPAWTRNTQFVLALYFEGAENYTVHHNLFYNITNSRGEGSFLYMGPRYSKIKGCHFYNNTVWNIDDRIRIWNYKRGENQGGMQDVHFANNLFMAGMENSYGSPISLESAITFTNNLDIEKSNEAATFISAQSGDYQLQSGSAAIDAGVVINGVTDGFKGSAPDVGCFESGTEPWRCGATIIRN